MFQEVMPLLAQQVVVPTLSRVSNEETCLKAIPGGFNTAERDETNAFTTPGPRGGNANYQT
jgi:hypothetical protein